MKRIYLLLLVMLCLGNVNSLIAKVNDGGDPGKPPADAEAVVMSIMAAPITAEVTSDNNLETSFESALGIVNITVADDATGIVYVKRSVDTSRTKKLPIKVLSSSGRYTVTYTDANGNKIQHGKFRIK